MLHKNIMCVKLVSLNKNLDVLINSYGLGMLLIQRDIELAFVKHTKHTRIEIIETKE